MNFPDIPETALRAFEQTHSLRVTIHDLSGSLWPFLAPERFQHTQPICQAVKLIGRANSCVAWEVTRQRREIAAIPEGRVQVCHAGFVEWTVPVFGKEGLEWMLFAGVRRAAPNLHATYDEFRALPDNFWQGNFDRPAPVSDDEAALLLEHLRQLAARLQLWRLENEAASQFTATGPRYTQPAENLAARRTLILRFIANLHPHDLKLSDLAAYLGLSEGRASHAVRESCGATFQDLVIQARLRTAMGLLRHSGLTVREVALSSGFNSPRQFFRLFQRETGTTPLQYRVTARG